MDGFWSDLPSFYKFGSNLFLILRIFSFNLFSLSSKQVDFFSKSLVSPILMLQLSVHFHHKIFLIKDLSDEKLLF
jgi:hypothetical protein